MRLAYYYSHTQHNSWHSYQTASPALQVVLDVGYFYSCACLDVLMVSVCLCVGHIGEPSKNGWTDQDVVWLNGGTYTWVPLVNTIMAKKFLRKYNSWRCQLMISALTLWVKWQEVVGCWRDCVWIKVQICIWPSWCHFHSLFLAPINPDWFYLSGFTFLLPAHLGSPGQNWRGS